MFLTPPDLTDVNLTSDFVVIGAGAAGIAVTQALHAAGHDVLLVEGGSFDIEPAAQALFEATSIGAPMRPEEGRYRIFGGTTVAWTGRCATLDPIDFERRDWVSGSGWPIGPDALAPFLDDAARLCGFADGWQIEPKWFGRSGVPAHPPELAEPYFWRLFATSRGTFRHFGELVYPAWSRSPAIRILLEADLIGLDATADARAIRSARLRARSGAILTVAARHFLLCCGGIENARLLLNFAADDPAPFSAAGDSLGRRFLQHPRAPTATIRASRAQAALLQRRFNLFRRPGLHHEAGFAIPATAQRRHRLLGASAVLRYGAPPGGRLGDAIVRPHRAVAAAVARARGRQPPIGRPEISLHVDVDQVPDPASRILLRPERDALGLRKAAVDWRIGDLERETAARFTRAVGGWIEALGMGDFEPVPDLDRTGGLTAGRMLESYHHIGATRMSDDPASGVVDRNLTVHGLANLHVCGASAMPTGGHANPTLTIVALALRLAEHLHRSRPFVG